MAGQHSFQQPFPTGGARPGRDPSLDFFRGVAMLIIFIAHVPWNMWANWIPARFGLSDATEMFVFCSGFAAALAFGKIFLRSGLWLGTARIVYRIWHIYAAHIAMFFFIAAISVFGTMHLGTDYVGKLNLHPFMNDTAQQLVGLFTLTYVPNYFDILPMYIGALALIPLVMAASMLHRLAGPAFVLILYTIATLQNWNLPAEPWSDRQWFFNPFGWQLIFFTGFSLAMGWIKPPESSRSLTVFALVFAIAVFPISYWPLWTKVAALKELREVMAPVIGKTDFGILRLVHFLCLAWLCTQFLKTRKHLLSARLVAPVIRVGQQSLPVFLFNMGFAWSVGMLLDQTERQTLTVAIVNIAGLATVICFAYLVSWIKSSPWKSTKTATMQTGDTATNRSGRPGPLPAPAE